MPRTREQGYSDLAGRILDADDRVLRVIVIGPQGEFLAASDSPRFRGKKASGDEFNRRSVAYSVAYGVAEGFASYMGTPRYLVFAFEDYKVLLTRASFPGGLVNVRIPRAVNAELVFNRILPLIRPK